MHKVPIIRELKKPLFFAMMYLIFSFGLIIIDQYYLLPSVIRNAAISNMALSKLFDQLRSFSGLLILPVLIFIGTLHVFSMLFLPKPSKKTVIKIASYFGVGVISLFMIYVIIHSILSPTSDYWGMYLFILPWLGSLSFSTVLIFGALILLVKRYATREFIQPLHPFKDL